MDDSISMVGGCSPENHILGFQVVMQGSESRRWIAK